VEVPKDSQNWARAGIDHVLLGVASQSHCALPLEKLKTAAVKLLEVPVETAGQAISQMLTSGSLLLEEIDGEPLIFLPHLRRAEDGIATKIKSGSAVSDLSVIPGNHDLMKPLADDLESLLRIRNRVADSGQGTTMTSVKGARKLVLKILSTGVRIETRSKSVAYSGG
jgi:exodeoxyribonuclease V alpha subunit